MKQVIKVSGMLLAGLCSEQASATCLPTSGFTSLDISMAVGRVVVRPSDAVGAILAKATFPINAGNSTISCNSSGGTVKADLTQGYPVSALGNNIYTTNIPGIGIRLYRMAQNNTNFSGYYPYTRSLNPNTNYTLTTGFFVVEVIKTASNTGSGALVPGRYSSYYSVDAPAKPILTSTVYGNAITIASSSCQFTSDINKVVTLPSVSKSGFKRVGSTQGEQSFNLSLQCNGGVDPTATLEKNTISLSVDFSAYGTNTAVMSNTAPASSQASGVGVQLVSDLPGNTNHVVVKGDTLALGQVISGQTVNFNIPMRARYYQAASSVVAGQVSGLATLTIQYN